MITIWVNFCTFADDKRLPKRKTFCKKKNEKLSKTENFASIKKLEITKHI